MAVDIKEYLSLPVLLVIFLLILSLMFVFPVLKMIILGAILAYGIRPIALKIQSKLKYSSVSILLAMVIVLIPLLLLVGYITYELSSLISSMLASSSYMEFNSALSQLVTYLPVNGDPTSISTYLNNSFESISSFLLNYSATALSKFANITLDLFILVCSIFYFVRDGDSQLQKFCKAFDGSGDPYDHVARFQQILYAEGLEDVHTMVQGFGLTLEGQALRMFQSLSNATLYDFEILVEAFIKENTKTGIKHNTLTQILDFKQKERETIKDAISRLKSLISRCPP